MVGTAIANIVPKIINALCKGFKLLNTIRIVPIPKGTNANGNSQTPNKLMRNASIFNTEPIAKKNIAIFIVFHFF